MWNHSILTLETDFGPQSTSYRPGWIKVLLLLAPLRPLRGREIWAPGIHAPCDSLVAQKVQRRFPFHSSGRRRIGSGMGPWASGGLVGSPPELGRRGAGGVVSAGCGSQAGRGPEPRGRVGKGGFSSAAFPRPPPPPPPRRADGRRQEEKEGRSELRAAAYTAFSGSRLRNSGMLAVPLQARELRAAGCIESSSGPAGLHAPLIFRSGRAPRGPPFSPVMVTEGLPTPRTGLKIPSPGQREEKGVKRWRELPFRTQ
ncbi:transcription factor 21 isoform X1 [Prionailurus viverrinus]|uniref:transcription factor 21 isoform X1 n=1 Tax=Prionailurus viverrinus TaxID=61388 RepID=UPI001FF52C16|nr:transcription factor 21 isoform X1 [Prionailurus viverrinus]